MSTFTLSLHIFIEASFFEVKFNNSLLDYANFSYGKGEYLSFSNSSLQNSDFDNFKLKEFTLENVNLEGSFIYNTSLENIDLSSSNINKISTTIDCLKGSVVSIDQALLIARMFVKIKDDL